MKKRRKNKGGTKYYMIMSIVCLTMLFTGYSFVYNLAEARKTGQDITTISFSYNGEEAYEKYGEFFDKVMSYFNIFFEENFKNDSSKIIENLDENNSKEVYKIIGSNEALKDELDVFNEDEQSNIGITEKEVIVASNRRDDFFKVIENEVASRSSIPRNISIDAASVNKNMNIILYHTHGTEAYSAEKSSNYRSRDMNKNVTGIGNIITANLSGYGINIKHLKDYNDYPSYNSSYKNSNAAVKKYLSNSKKNLIIDLHRDGAEENSSYENFLNRVSTIQINNKTAATFSIVIGDKNGNLSELKKIAQTVHDISNEMYPNLCREIIIRPGAYFNQYLSDNALLIEIGSTVNNLPEVEYTADLLSEILCKTIVKINN